MSMIEKSFLGLGPHGFHRVVYFEWGDPACEQVLVCVHGLTRRGRDFDDLARAMQDRYRVVCVDLPGRGGSDWLPVAADYQPGTYIQDMAALIARLGVERVDWLGVSLGGLMGMMLAAQPKTPIRRLILDDIGGYVGVEALLQIAEFVGKDPAFADQAGLEAYMRQVNTGYGLLTDAQWAQLARHASRQDEAGAWRQHYDPKLAEPFRQGFSEPVTLWPLWDLIATPTLILRGTESQILTAETAAEMLARKPGTRLVEFPGVGHAPMLMALDQITAVRSWLLDA
ncbi:MAG TPA: alpha/beta hydrolase [Rhodospirillales bacterium]|nr:alpha/beta hydrolase [Rhodospirillales bacterium]